MTELSKIPIQNIYYLLCYAWNKLEERDIVDVSGIETTSLWNLFAKVLIGGLNHLLKRGLDRGYVPYSEDSRCLRGKLCFAPMIKRNLFATAQVHCEYDELSYNVLHNQILKAMLRLLIDSHTVDDKDIQDQLTGLYRRLHEIDEVRLSASLFNRVQLHRNNAFYDFPLKICELIYNNLLVSEDTGKSKFRDFVQDRKKMAKVFEDFVRNFYKIERPDCGVSGKEISWNLEPSDKYVPKMKTDISIELGNSRVVIDTKYYREALVTNQYGQEKIRSTHLYQIIAYLKNLEAKDGINRYCSGILLYPTVDKDIHLNYRMDGHKIMIRTINLNQDWKLIRSDLLNILETAMLND